MHGNQNYYDSFFSWVLFYMLQFSQKQIAQNMLQFFYKKTYINIKKQKYESNMKQTY